MTMTRKVAGGLLMGLVLAAFAPTSVEAGSRSCRSRSRSHYDSRSHSSYYDGRSYDDGYYRDSYVDHRAPYVGRQGGYSRYYSRPRHVARPYRSYSAPYRYNNYYRPRTGVHVDIHLGF
jgi:hypothetical protein